MTETPRPSFFEVVFHQRACRDFVETPIPEETLEVVLRAATHAPSAENSQPWVFVVVRDDDRRSRLEDLTRRAWESVARDFSKGRIDAALFADTDRGASGGIGRAPVVVVVGVDLERCLEPAAAESIWPAVQNLLLAANAQGLGSALTTLPLLATSGDEGVSAAVGLPAHIRPVAVVPLGFPAAPLGPPRRRPVTEVTHREEFGRKW